MKREVLRQMLGAGHQIDIWSIRVRVELNRVNGPVVVYHRPSGVENCTKFSTIQDAIEEALKIIIDRYNIELNGIIKEGHRFGFEQEDSIQIVKEVDVEEIMES